MLDNVYVCMYVGSVSFWFQQFPTSGTGQRLFISTDNGFLVSVMRFHTSSWLRRWHWVNGLYLSFAQLILTFLGWTPMSPSRGAQLFHASPQSFLKSALSLIYWLMAKGSLEGPCLMLKLWHHLSDLFQVLSRWTPNSSNEDTTLEHITQVIHELDFTLGSPLFSLAKGARKFRDFAERRDQDIFFPHKKSGSVS